MQLVEAGADDECSSTIACSQVVFGKGLLQAAVPAMNVVSTAQQQQQCQCPVQLHAAKHHRKEGKSVEEQEQQQLQFGCLGQFGSRVPRSSSGD